MNIFETFLINSLFILFPLLLYLIYNAYSSSNKDKKEIMLELSLFSSIYMLIRFGIVFRRTYQSLLISVPLLIGFLNDKLKTNIIISIVSILFFAKTFNANLYLIILEYILYFICYFIYKKHKNKNVFVYSFILIRVFAITVNTVTYLNIGNPYKLLFAVLFGVLMYMVEALLIVYFYDRAGQIIDYNSTLNELKREKEIHASLFKLTHEVKNPLAVCKGYFEMMDDSEDKDRYIRIIREEVDKTLNIMDDFLSFTKIKCSMEELDIFLVLNDIKEEIEPLLDTKNINCEFIIPDKEVYIDGDYIRLKEVLTNIYKNSVESLKDHPKIKLKATCTNNSVTIKIKDNGIGMDEYTLKSMGKNFFTTKENGTGLGVPLSKEIIRMHGGTLKYKSKEGIGTTAIINLPIKSSSMAY